MSMIKFLVAALAVAPFTLSNHYEQSAFIASSALAVAIAAGARPPGLLCATVFGAAWRLAPVAVFPVLCLLAWWCQSSHTGSKHRSRRPRRRSTVAELTSSNVNGARGLARAPHTAHAHGSAIGCGTSAVGLKTTREQWLDAIARAANAQPWAVNAVTGPAADKFGWRNGTALRSAARALGLDETGTVPQLRARVDEWAESVEVPSTVPSDPAEAAMAAACPNVVALLGNRIKGISDAEALVAAVSQEVMGDIGGIPCDTVQYDKVRFGTVRYGTVR